MKPMVIEKGKLLMPNDIATIIEACGKAGVRTLKYGDLYLAFGPAPKIENKIEAAIPDHDAINAETLEQDEQEIRDERLRMMLIEDPVEYERQLRDGELTDDASDEGDDGEA